MSAENEAKGGESAAQPPAGPVTFRISTGLVIAAGYANKLRRVALVSMSKQVPKDVIIRDISEFNKRLFEELISTKRIDKLDIIRLNVTVEYDPAANRLNFKEYKLIRYVPEERCGQVSQEDIQKLREENERLRAEISSLKDKLNEILSTLNRNG
ncbi:MAG: DUF2258 domain-containing protein [Nitrososphaeria archaeon]